MSTSSAAAPTHCLIPCDRLVARVGVFYGYVMLAAATVALVATSPGQTFAMSCFNPALVESLGISQAQLTGAYLLGTVLACLPLGLVGALMDRHGIRRTMSLTAVLFGGACLFMSQVSGWVSLLIAFFLLRMLGQGALTLLAQNTTAMWFHRRLGLAAGVSSVGMSCAFAIVPRVNLWLIDHVGWRMTYVILGLAVWGILLPMLAIVFRNRPEDIGQLPDGQAPPEAAEIHCAEVAGGLPAVAAEPPTSLIHFTPGEALRTRAYWIMLTMHAAWALVGTAIVFSVLPLFASRGLSASVAANFFTAFAVAMATMQLAGGWLADRAPLNVLLFVSMSGMIAGVGLLLAADSAAFAYAYALLYGGSQGLFGAVSNTAWARYYGRAHLGKIRASVWTVAVAGSGVGPFVMGLAATYLGGYDVALWIFAGLLAPLVIAAPWATAPREKQDEAANEAPSAVAA